MSVNIVISNIPSGMTWNSTSPDWVSVSPSSGTGPQTVEATFSPNAGVQREGDIVFTAADGATATTHVTQLQLSQITATPTNITVDAAGNEYAG